MFKNLQIYRPPQPWPIKTEELEDRPATRLLPASVVRQEAENIRVETTFAGLDANLIPLAEKLYDGTADWQASGIGAPSSFSDMTCDRCVSALWAGKVPACKPRIKEIMGVETAE